MAFQGSANYIWYEGDILGQGASGAVYKARHKVWVNKEAYLAPVARCGVSSLPEMELTINSRVGIDYLKKLELINFELESKFPTKHLIHKLIYH